MQRVLRRYSRKEYKSDSRIHKESAKRNILTSGLISTYPFISSNIFDEEGIFIGTNIYNNSLTRTFRDPIEYIRISKLLMQESSYLNNVCGIQEYEESYYLKNLFISVLGLYVNGTLEGYGIQKRSLVIKEFLRFYFTHREISIPYKSKKAKFLYLLLWNLHSPRLIDLVLQRWFSVSYKN